MTETQYLLWVAVWNASLQQGLDGAEALQRANEAVAGMREGAL